MDEFEAEKLAIEVLGLSEKYLRVGTVEHALHMSLDVTLEQFRAVADALLPFTLPGASMLTGELFHGYVKNDEFVVKSPCKDTLED